MPFSHAPHCELPDDVHVTFDTQPAIDAQEAHARFCMPPQLCVSYSSTAHAAAHATHAPPFMK